MNLRVIVFRWAGIPLQLTLLDACRAFEDKADTDKDKIAFAFSVSSLGLVTVFVVIIDVLNSLEPCVCTSVAVFSLYRV